MTRRHAVYFAPAPATALHELGSRWLGRDAFTGEALAQLALPGLSDVTGDPRRYGFHATLKPPFALRDTVSPEGLLRATAALAASRQGFQVRLKVALLDRFLALVAVEGGDRLQQLADCAVRELDGFRQPPSPEELARRRMASLSPRQEAHLAQWGYPYVFEDFRFHMTLTERLHPEDAQRFTAAAEAHFAAVLADPVTVDCLTLFEEATSGAAFLATRQFPLSSPTAEAAA